MARDAGHGSQWTRGPEGGTVGLARAGPCVGRQWLCMAKRCSQGAALLSLTMLAAPMQACLATGSATCKHRPTPGRALVQAVYLSFAMVAGKMCNMMGCTIRPDRSLHTPGARGAGARGICQPAMPCLSHLLFIGCIADQFTTLRNTLSLRCCLANRRGVGQVGIAAAMERGSCKWGAAKNVIDDMATPAAAFMHMPFSTM